MINKTNVYVDPKHLYPVGISSNHESQPSTVTCAPPPCYSSADIIRSKEKQTINIPEPRHCMIQNNTSANDDQDGRPPQFLGLQNTETA